MTIDRGILAEIVERFADAIGAVERGNDRAVAVARKRRCIAAVIATGVAPADCR